MRGVYLASAFIGAAMFSVGLAAARGTLMGDTGAIASSSGGSGGLAIGDAIAGGTAGRLLYEGAGPVLDDDAAYRVLEGTAGSSGSAQNWRAIQVKNEADPSAYPYSYAYAQAANSAGNVSQLFVRGTSWPGTWSGGDGTGYNYAGAPRLFFYSPNDSEAVIQTQTGNSNTLHFVFGGGEQERMRIGPGASVSVFGAFKAGSGGLPRYTEIDQNGYLVQVSGVGTAFHKGQCTLNGGVPAQCTTSIPYVPFGTTPVCTCTLVGTTAASAKKGCAVDVGGSTVTVTSDNGSTEAVNVGCW